MPQRDMRVLSCIIWVDAVPAYDVSPDELSLDRFKEDYRKATGRKLQDNHLKNMGLFIYEQEQLWATNATVLLSESPARKRLFPYAKIECARFKGTDIKEFLDQASIDEPIYAAVEPCLAFIKKNIALGSRIGEVFREDRWEYPLEAIREAIANAIIHRDYSILGSDIKVAIFDDMLEITNPGPLPDTLSLEELGTGRSEIRNRVLAPIFKDLKLIEAWGTGIQRMKNELNSYPEIELVLQEAGHAFQVQFRKNEKAVAKSRTGLSISAGEVCPKSVPSLSQVCPKSVPSSLFFALLDIAREPVSIEDLMKVAGQTNRTRFRKTVLRPLLDANILAMTIPDKPKSSKQRYRLTDNGREILKTEKDE